MAEPNTNELKHNQNSLSQRLLFLISSFVFWSVKYLRIIIEEKSLNKVTGKEEKPAIWPLNQ